MKVTTDTANAAAAAYTARVDRTDGQPLGAGGRCYLLSGTQPASAATAFNPGNLVATVSLPNPAFLPPVNGSAAWPATIQGVAAQTGMLTWFRMANRDGVGQWDGQIAAWDGVGPQPVADMIIGNASLVQGEAFTVSYSLQVPLGS